MQTKPKRIREVGVIGAGVMGAGIAAQLANAGLKVQLLDIVPPKFTDADKAAGLTEDSKAFRNKFAAGALKKLAKLKPANFYHKSFAQRITIGNLQDDLERLSSCDWVVEVVLENMGVKQELFAKLEGVIGENAIVSSNTSGLSIAGMLEGRSDSFKERFLVTHFFNPPRYLHLLELVSGPDSRDDVKAAIADLSENVLGKGVVWGKDTTNFIANRIGVFGMMDTMRVMQEDGYTIEEVDAVFGPATGRPKSAVFRTADVVGLDTFVHVAQNCWDNLQDDEYHDVFQVPQMMKDMVANGWTGQKAGQGFYKKEGKEIFALDLKTMEYRPKAKVRTDSLGAVRNIDDVGEKINLLAYAEDTSGQLTWKVLARTCIYSALRLGEIADTVLDIDNAVKWGFGWELGPFETWDAVDVAKSVERMKGDGLQVPSWVTDMLANGRKSFYDYNEQGQKTFWDPRTQEAVIIDEGDKVQRLTILKRDKNNVVKDGFATTLVDLGDGILCCEFHTKMNAIDGDIVNGLNEALDLCEDGQFDALVLGNDGANFSAGANLLLMYMAAQQGEWETIEKMVKSFQDVCRRLKYSSIPTVAAPFNLTLGGGAEVSLWCDAIQAHAELYMGLVEVGVGLIPGGGGNIEMMARNLARAVDKPEALVDPLLQRAFESVAMAKVATSADEARANLFLTEGDGITLNRRHLLFAAKQKALSMANGGYRPMLERTYRLPGKTGFATFQMAVKMMADGGFVSEHDQKIGLQVAKVMTGGDCDPRVPVTEQALLDLEREAFMSLVGEEKSQERIAYMLQNNKPLRN